MFVCYRTVYSIQQEMFVYLTQVANPSNQASFVKYLTSANLIRQGPFKLRFDLSWNCIQYTYLSCELKLYTEYWILYTEAPPRAAAKIFNFNFYPPFQAHLIFFYLCLIWGISCISHKYLSFLLSVMHFMYYFVNIKISWTVIVRNTILRRIPRIGRKCYIYIKCD